MSTAKYKPPFTITPKILTLCQQIERYLGILEGLKIDKAPVTLRRENKIKTIQASLAIEGNSLDINEICSILGGKIVQAPRKDIIEVKNALNLYEKLHELNPLAIESLNAAHQILMQDLITANGKFRTKGVGIFKGDAIAHMAPPAKQVPYLIQNLFNFLQYDTDTPWLIKACVFHYELEFIHPFSDGNGRMGRLWQQLLLMQADPIFEFIAIEALIKDSQEQYYNTLAACDKIGESTLFIEYSLAIILTALSNYVQNLSPQVLTVKDRLEFAKQKFANLAFSRKQYINLHKNISTATASRDLLYGIAQKILTKSGTKNQTTYSFL